MINLKDMIESGDFYSIEFEYDDELINIRVRVESLYPIIWDDVDDDHNEITDIEVGDNLWLMDVTFINLNKKKVGSETCRCILKLVDEEGFEFDSVNDFYLCRGSDFAKKSRLDKLYYNDLKPKIPRSGALIYELPEGFEELYLKVENGIISAI